MILLHSVVLLCVAIISSQELLTTASFQDKPSLLQDLQPASIKDEIRDLKVRMAQQNTLISRQNTKIAQQNTRIEEKNTRFEQLNTKFEQQNTRFAQQNTKLAEQDTTIAEQNAKIKELETHFKELDNDPEFQSTQNNSTSASVFTRWGRRDCPETVSQLVYSGITGGSHYTHTGGAAEYVCLPPDPIWNTHKHYNGPYWGYMYGSEYSSIPQPVLDFNVPCAVCRTTQYSTALMIPARTQCYPGWQEAYHGELVSEYYKHLGASQYVCLDDNPQTNGTNKNEDGRLMYPVRAKCGSLPCPPYEDNTLLTCVVCLK